MTITTGLIAYCIFSALFTVFILLLLKGGGERNDDNGACGADEGNFPASRFEGDING